MAAPVRWCWLLVGELPGSEDVAWVQVTECWMRGDDEGGGRHAGGIAGSRGTEYMSERRSLSATTSAVHRLGYSCHGPG